MDTQEHDAEVAHIKNELNKYLADIEIKSTYETLVRFGIPYVKIMDVQKSVVAKMIMLQHTHIQL